ncbi:hypothetical protein HOLleu_27029 [Holothuria leucospilota]|uniref:Uncharacterized protein n=1 Tax=Holothuria leucospilota TaxID=206669 RepID=A0A9Q1BQ80_HOLLE|nr:hypothetical protein HOLleu_27029 [Holothuria leucospilota]
MGKYLALFGLFTVLWAAYILNVHFPDGIEEGLKYRVVGAGFNVFQVLPLSVIIIYAYDVIALANQHVLSLWRALRISERRSPNIYAAYNHQFYRSIDIQFLRLGINPITGRHHLQTEQNYRNFRLKLRNYSKLNKYFVANIVPNCHCPACAEFKIKNLCFDIPHSPTELANWPHRNRNGFGYGNFLRPINQPCDADIVSDNNMAQPQPQLSGFKVELPPHFLGSGNEDFMQWCRRMEVALDAAPNGVGADLAKLLPSRLGGAAFSFWDSLPPEDNACANGLAELTEQVKNLTKLVQESVSYQNYNRGRSPFRYGPRPNEYNRGRSPSVPNDDKGKPRFWKSDSPGRGHMHGGESRWRSPMRDYRYRSPSPNPRGFRSRDSTPNRCNSSPRRVSFEEKTPSLLM